ncbi:MAG: hypothetical protein F6K63_29810 [Moorea sp. SIO1G6]|uniref:hypothetical protein n=1 Tax=Moorena sp. SIO1G6 TaxID=2607840 RepID=UPI0013BEEB89|nr:hypothetical protein [Moorena sp. SIO1G6]NET68366.1 hypothetical protein [Moorena sp. SIO1G6]
MDKAMPSLTSLLVGLIALRIILLVAETNPLVAIATMAVFVFIGIGWWLWKARRQNNPKGKSH